MKLPRLITRRQAKWAGICASVCLATAMIASYWHMPNYYWTGAKSEIKWVAGIGPGVVSVARCEITELNLATHADGWDFDIGRARLSAFRSWKIFFPPLPHPSGWRPTYKFVGQSFGDWQRVSIPLWIPLVLIAVPTAWLWYIDSRPKPWQCANCRYDLRGLERGVCPECGQHATASCSKISSC